VCDVQSRHATVSFEDMLETLKRSGQQKVCLISCFPCFEILVSKCSGQQKVCLISF
jgi:hypothetical protein